MTRTHTSRTARRSRLALVLAALLASLATPARGEAATSAGYGWPLEPFHRQHPVRAFFGDPRLVNNAAEHGSFHFGIDISCPDGTPVYATLDGTALLDRRHAQTVTIRGADGHTVFSYWHVVPVVPDGAVVTAYRTVIGRVRAPWGHVHFAESVDGVYRNPLRSGGLGPYEDTTRPVVRSPRAERSGRTVRLDEVGGVVDIVVEALDRTPIEAPRPWNGKPVTPVLVRWRLGGHGGVVVPWRTAVDFRATIPPPSAFRSVYARWTRQNRPSQRGRYRIFLAHHLDTRQLLDGVYRLQVEVVDTRGNRGVLSVPVRVANGRGDT